MLVNCSQKSNPYDPSPFLKKDNDNNKNADHATMGGLTPTPCHDSHYLKTPQNRSSNFTTHLVQQTHFSYALNKLIHEMYPRHFIAMIRIFSYEKSSNSDEKSSSNT